MKALVRLLSIFLKKQKQKLGFERLRCCGTLVLFSGFAIVQASYQGALIQDIYSLIRRCSDIFF